MRHKRRHHHHHHHHRAASGVVLAITDIVIDTQENLMNVTLTWTTPTTRIDGSSLALTDIASTVVLRNDLELTTVVAVAGTNTYVDTTPLTGVDEYEIVTVTTDGLRSAESNAVIITVVAANPAAAITDLAGVLAP